MKKCGCCKQVLSLDCFQKNRVAPDGLQYRCKDCTRKSSRACRIKRGHLWQSVINPWKKRPENRSRSNASARARRAKNPDKIRVENRGFRERNPFSVAACVSNLRALKLGIEGVISAQEWKDVVEKANFICNICGGKVSFEIGSPSRISLDHIIPLSRGGTNIKENIAPAHYCCNKARSNMTLEEFDLWLDKVYLNRRSGHGGSKESEFISQPPPPLGRVVCIEH